MGDHNIQSASNDKARQRFIHNLLDDIEALELMLKEDKIEKGIVRIGAEQEFCIVDKNWRPNTNSQSVLKTINDPHFTTELAKYNLEINLDPFELKQDALSRLEAQLRSLLQKAEEATAKENSEIILTGILPSITTHEIGLGFMTEHSRYYALNDVLKKLRGNDFRLHLSGVDELSMGHDSVMFEACNTSFQMHLQIDPDDFISSYNWAQAISGPVLGLCVNSPILLGRELWQETRVAVFQQSIDTRDISYALKDQQSRVTFGERWASGTVADLYKNEISRFRIILTKEIKESSLDQLSQGKIPKLEALSLHNGTIYRWNRPCYGVGDGKAHLRIENRYIPAGPTIIDEMANFAFWAGLMVGRPKEFDNIRKTMDFKDAKSNFIKAARYGSESIMMWMGEEIPVKDLVLNKLLPIAYSGLRKMKIHENDINRYLQIIENRVQRFTPAHWMIRNYRALKKNMKQDDALIALTKAIHQNQKTDIPVHGWPAIEIQPQATAVPTKLGHIMSTQLFTAFMDDTAELTLQVMTWKKIHHLPIVNHNEALVGLLTWSHIQKFNQEKTSEEITSVAHIMIKDVLTADTSTNIKGAIKLMKNNAIGCLPVLQKNQLVGIVTIKDLLPFDND